MKGQWLFLSIASLCILYFPHYFLLWVMLFGVFHFKHFHQGHFLFLILLTVIWGIAIDYKQEIPMPESNVLKIVSLKEQYAIGAIGRQKVLLYGLENVNYGDIITVEGSYEKIESYHNFGEFHFPTWAKNHKIYYQVQVKSFQHLQRGKSLRSWFYSHITHLSQITNSSILLALLFGIKKAGEESTFITSSGLHMQTLMKWSQKVLSFWFSTHTSKIISIGILGIIALFTTFTTTFKRMLCFQLVSLFFINYDEKDRLGLSIYICICLFPYMIYEIGFLLPIIFHFIHIFNIKKINRFIITYLVCIPIQFYFYGSVNLLEIALFPIFRIFYGILYFLAWCSAIFPFLLHILIFLYTTVCSFIEGIESLTFYYSSTSVWQCAWFYFTLKYISYQKKKDICILVCLFLFTQLYPYINPFGEILIIDVGQGDSALITLPFHQGAMLIDVAGNQKKNIPQDIIYPILRKKGIHKLDYVVITHDDFDHSGGLSQLEELIEIEEVIVEKREKIILGNVEFAMLLPDLKWEDKNENSLLLFSELYGMNVLFMGDAGIEVEKEILKRYPLLQVDLLKVGHHGSKTSSSLPFLHEIQPQLGLISAGRNNFYGHPHQEVLNALKQENIHTLCTAEHGAIQIKFSKFINFYRTANKEFGIIK